MSEENTAFLYESHPKGAPTTAPHTRASAHPRESRPLHRHSCVSPQCHLDTTNEQWPGDETDHLTNADHRRLLFSSRITATGQRSASAETFLTLSSSSTGGGGDGGAWLYNSSSATATGVLSARWSQQHQPPSFGMKNEGKRTTPNDERLNLLQPINQSMCDDEAGAAVAVMRTPSYRWSMRSMSIGAYEPPTRSEGKPV